MKAANEFAEYVTKYSLYIVAGIIAIASVWLARRQLLAFKDGDRGLLPQSTLVLATLIAVATIAMSIQLNVEAVENYSIAWWSWLILAFVREFASFLFFHICRD